MEFHAGNVVGDTVEVMACTGESSRSSDFFIGLPLREETECRIVKIVVPSSDLAQYAHLGSTAAAVAEAALTKAFAAVGAEALQAKQLSDLAKLTAL